MCVLAGRGSGCILHKVWSDILNLFVYLMQKSVFDRKPSTRGNETRVEVHVCVPRGENPPNIPNSYPFAQMNLLSHC